MISEVEHAELSAWIAEHVFGYRWWSFNANGVKWCQLIPPSERWPHIKRALWKSRRHRKRPEGYSDETPGSIPRFTIDLAAALGVLEKCLERNQLEFCKTVDGVFHIIGLDFDEETTAEANTLPLVICLYARKCFAAKGGATRA